MSEYIESSEPRESLLTFMLYRLAAAWAGGFIGGRFSKKQGGEIAAYFLGGLYGVEKRTTHNIRAWDMSVCVEIDPGAKSDTL